jgi:leucyl-tRNA synthetase
VRQAARRETDTMDTFVDVLVLHALLRPEEQRAMVAGGADYWMPMDQYIGGIEHAILHLLYARFWTKVMRDLGLVRSTSPSPSCSRRAWCSTTSTRAHRKGGKEYFWPHDVEHVLDEGGKIIGAKLKNAVGDCRWARPSTTRAWAPCPSPRTTASTRRT